MRKCIFFLIDIKNQLFIVNKWTIYVKRTMYKGVGNYPSRDLAQLTFKQLTGQQKQEYTQNNNK